MKIDGKQIASEIFESLTKKVLHLKEKGIIPSIAIILVGDNPASVSYVHQKVKKAEEIGAMATVINLESRIQNSELLELIQKLNNDPKIHGIIVQRPLPNSIDSQLINQSVDLKKDVDAFRLDSPYKMPLATAVVKILEYIYKFERDSGVANAPQNNVILVTQSEAWRHPESSIVQWLRDKNLVVVGKGETGGGPTIELLKKMGIEPHVIDSKTVNSEEITRNADIIVSTVGKPNIIKPENIKEGVILIGVGMHKGSDGKLHGDYDEEKIKNIASFYTPIPGGVGPINVAMLLENLVRAAKLKPKL